MSSITATIVPPVNAPAATMTEPEAWLEKSIFFTLVALALFAPVWTKAAVLSFRVALLLWIVKLIWLRPKLPSLSIVKPLLFYLFFVFISTLFSPLPILSWGRMRTVELFLIAFLVALNVNTVRQIRVLVFALVFATLVSVGFTAWQYWGGIGVKLTQPVPASLRAAGFGALDVITSVEQKSVRTPEQWKRALNAASGRVIKLRVLRWEPPRPLELRIPKALLIADGLLSPGSVTTARPERAQGFFDNYVPYAEVLMLMSLLVFGLCFGAAQAKARAAVASWGLVFLAILAALIATETRAALAAVLALAALMIWLVSGWKVRIATGLGLALLFIAGSYWLHQHRGEGWLGRRDPGTIYRELMWKDGIRLALEHPFVGIGMDTVESRGNELHIVAYKRFPNLKSHFHSTYIQIAAECGLFALACWGWFVVALAVQLWKRSRQGNFLVLGIFGALAAFMLISFVHYSLGDAEFLIPLWVAIGIAMSPLFAVGDISGATA